MRVRNLRRATGACSGQLYRLSRHARTSVYDYILADATVLPSTGSRSNSEKIIHLPDSYLVSDSKRPVCGADSDTRGGGLPAEGFVFLLLQQLLQDHPPDLRHLDRLLDRVAGSVLWLYRDRAAAETNLRREAAARGIDPARLVFARRVPSQDHLARHRLADLFLDTLPYNAHTTASDALWVGLPVITCRGQSFAGASQRACFERAACPSS